MQGKKTFQSLLAGAIKLHHVPINVDTSSWSLVTLDFCIALRVAALVTMKQ